MKRCRIVLPKKTTVFPTIINEACRRRKKKKKKKIGFGAEELRCTNQPAGSERRGQGNMRVSRLDGARLCVMQDGESVSGNVGHQSTQNPLVRRLIFRSYYHHFSRPGEDLGSRISHYARRLARLFSFVIEI